MAQARASEVQKSNSRFVNAVNVSLDGIIVADRNGRIVDFNPSAESIFGYSRNRAIGSEMADLIVPPALRDAHRAGMKRFLDTGQPKIIGELTALRRRYRALSDGGFRLLRSGRPIAFDRTGPETVRVHINATADTVDAPFVGEMLHTLGGVENGDGRVRLGPWSAAITLPAV